MDYDTVAERVREWLLEGISIYREVKKLATLEDQKPNLVLIRGGDPDEEND